MCSFPLFISIYSILHLTNHTTSLLVSFFYFIYLLYYRILRILYSIHILFMYYSKYRSSKQLRFKVRSEVKKYGDAYWTENQQTLEDYVDEMNNTLTDTTDFLRLLRSGPAPASASSLPRPPPRTPWTEDEEMRLVYGIRTYGRTAWKQIAETLLPARYVRLSLYCTVLRVTEFVN